MIKPKNVFRTLTILICLSAGYQGFSQSFGDVLSTGADNAETYLINYASPAINAFGNGMSEGWYNTAKPHKALGFNITISPSFAFIPNSDQSFQFDANDYTDLTLEGDDDGILPTLVGGDAQSGSELVFTGEASYPGIPAIVIPGEQRFDVPSGVINLKDVPFAGAPAPTYNIGIGVSKGTDLKLRILPPVSAGDFSTNIIGLGVMHDVKQWIPGVKALPFDLSAFVGSSRMTMKYDIDVDVNNGTSRFEGDGQAIFKTTATTVQGIISKKLLFFTPYFALGFNAVKSTLDVNGNYTYTVPGNTSDVKDPISAEFSGAGGLRSTIGAQLQFAVLTIHGAYTLQRYNTFSMGLGVSLR